MKIAIVCPDGRSVVLFCKGIIEGLSAASDAKVVVLTEAGSSRADIEALHARCVDVSLYRYLSPIRDIFYLLRLYRIFRSERFDIVYNISTKPNVFGAFAAHFAGVPRVFAHVVGLGSVLLPATTIRARTMQFVLLGLYRLAARWTERLWFSNKNNLEFFVERRIVQPEQTLLTNTYLDVEYYSPAEVSGRDIAEARRELGISESQKVVLMVARMIWPKGIREFVEAAKLLAKSSPDLRFLLIAPLEPGNPDEVPEAFINDNKEAGSLIWLQYRNDLRPYYALSDLAVLPTYYKEGGQPRALLEPMAMGKPVIATTSEDCRGAIEEGRNGFLVPPRDAVALAAAISRVMGDDTLRDSLGNYSRVMAVRDFDEAVIVPDALRKLGFPIST